jgi:DNA invertase Pin-like site-specific DNA recombinase
MLTLLGAVARFEREMMLERQREGIAKAKSEGRYKGRKPIAEDLRHNVLKLAAVSTTRKAIASQLGIGEAAVYRILATQTTPTLAPGKRRKDGGTEHLWAD